MVKYGEVMRDLIITVSRANLPKSNNKVALAALSERSCVYFLVILWVLAVAASPIELGVSCNMLKLEPEFIFYRLIVVLEMGCSHLLVIIF